MACEDQETLGAQAPLSCLTTRPDEPRSITIGVFLPQPAPPPASLSSSAEWEGGGCPHSGVCGTKQQTEGRKAKWGDRPWVLWAKSGHWAPWPPISTLPICGAPHSSGCPPVCARRAAGSANGGWTPWNLRTYAQGRQRALSSVGTWAGGGSPSSTHSSPLPGVCSFIHARPHSLVLSQALVCSFAPSFSPSFGHLFIHSFSHSFICSFAHSLITFAGRALHACW